MAQGECVKLTKRIISSRLMQPLCSDSPFFPPSYITEIAFLLLTRNVGSNHFSAIQNTLWQCERKK